MSEYAADLVEVFSSVQGEGLLVGLRQVFVRFAECNLACEYCDTRHAGIDFCQMEFTPGRRDFVRAENPVPFSKLLSLIDQWSRSTPGLHHSISLTGGEPLLYHEMLQHWLPELTKRLPVHLETNGTLFCALESLISHFEYISMDIKVPSTSGISDPWQRHREFLTIANRKNCYVKIVVSSGTEDDEIIRSADIISSVNRDIPLILQPLMLPDNSVGVSALRTLELQEIASRYLRQVRIIPQTHKFLGQL